MFGFGKKGLTADDAAKAFLNVGHAEMEATFQGWVSTIVEAADARGQRGESFRRRIAEHDQAAMVYMAGIMAMCMPAVKNLFGSEANQAVLARLHHHITTMQSAETQWFSDFLFELLKRPVDPDSIAFITTEVLKHYGLLSEPADRAILQSPIFLLVASDAFLRQPIVGWWKAVSEKYKIVP